MNEEGRVNRPSKNPIRKRLFSIQSDPPERTDLLFSMNDLGFSYIKGRKHFTPKMSATKEWKPCIRLPKQSNLKHKISCKVTSIPSDTNPRPCTIQRMAIRKRPKTVCRMLINVEEIEVKNLDNWEINVLRSPTVLDKYKQFREQRTGIDCNSGSCYLSASLM